MTKKNLFGCLFFIVFWLIPLAYIGLTNWDFPFLPRTVSYLQRIAFLFTHGIPSWPIYYIQGLPEGGKQWIDLPEEDYFQLKPFGYRTRLHQMLIDSHYGIGYVKGKERAKAREAEAARWIAKKYSEKHKDSAELSTICFVRASYPVDPKPKEGRRWRKPPLASFSAGQIEVISTHLVGDELSFKPVS